jgi:NitT/TauT family transport system substrate-binding protein
MSRKWQSLTLATSLLALAVGMAEPLAAEEPTKVGLVQTHPVISVGEEFFLYAIPRHLGYFRDEGLDVFIEGAAGGTPAAQALQSGAVQFATTMPESVMQVREQGGDVISFYNIKRDNGVAIAMLPDAPMREMADLKGKILGGLSWGSGGPPLVVHALAAMGIGPNEYTRVTIGGGAAAAVALTSHQVDAVILWDAMFGIMENGGTQMRYIDLPIQRQLAGFTLATTERYIQSNPKQVEAYCRAINKALYFTRNNVTAAVQIGLEEFPTLNPPGADPAKTLKDDVHIMEWWLGKAEIGVPLDAKTGDLLPEQWEFSENYYHNEGMLQGTKPASAAFTNRFFEKCNDFDRAAVATAAKSYKPS